MSACMKMSAYPSFSRVVKVLEVSPTNKSFLFKINKLGLFLLLTPNSSAIEGLFCNVLKKRVGLRFEFLEQIIYLCNLEQEHLYS